jgi:rubredoxin
MELKKRNNLIRILAKGGVLTPTSLLDILSVAQKFGNKHIHFGSRQDILFPIPAKQTKEVTDELAKLKIEYILPDNLRFPNYQNIVSSYAAADLMPATAWLNAGNYLKVLEQLADKHILRINIADARQNMVPLFYGNLNFVASTHQNYWFLYLRLPDKHELVRWPQLVADDEIAILSSFVEKYFLQNKAISIPDLIELVMRSYAFQFKSIDEDLKIIDISQQEYEGFGRMHASNRHWAGFYWRNNRYDIPFLEEVCKLCIRTGISKISITTWKSFLIKDIEPKDLILWHRLLGSYGITMRHSALELNWHVPLLSASALRLKRYIVKHFDRTDVCVHGLTFGITNGKEIPFCTIMIQKRYLLHLPFLGGIFVQYDVLYAKDFKTSTCEYITEVTGYPNHRLPDVISALSRRYFAELKSETTRIEALSPKPIQQFVHQCTNCKTTYNAEFGDPAQNILPGTAFEMLPETYLCPVCDSAKTDFARKELKLIAV